MNIDTYSIGIAANGPMISLASMIEISNKIEGFSIDELENIRVRPSKAKGHKCQRCWKYEEVLIKNEICNRCNEAIN